MTDVRQGARILAILVAFLAVTGAFAGESKDCHKLISLFEYDGPAHFGDHPTAFQQSDGFVATAGYTDKNAAGSDADGFVIQWNPLSPDPPVAVEWDGPAGGFDSFNDAHFDRELADGPLFAAGYSTNAGTNGDFTLVVFDADGNVINDDFFDGGASGEDCAFSVTRSGNALYAVGYTQPSGQADVDWAVVKYDLSGNRLWDRTLVGDGGDNDIARKVTPDGQGGIVVGGETVGDTGPELTGARWDEDGNLVGRASIVGPLAATRSRMTNIVMIDDTLLIGGNYIGADDLPFAPYAAVFDTSDLSFEQQIAFDTTAELMVVERAGAGSQTGTLDLAVFGFNPQELTAAGDKGAEQEALFSAYDMNGERAWHGVWDASDQGLLGDINDFDDNGDALVVAAHTIDEDDTVRAALLLFDHRGWDDEAKDTFVLPHLLETSGPITATGNVFDSTVFADFTPGLLPDDEPAVTGVVTQRAFDATYFDVLLFALDVSDCFGDDDDDDDDDDMTGDDDDDDDMTADDDDDDDVVGGGDDDDDDACGGCGGC